MGAVHVVLRIRRGLPGLRTPRGYRALERAFRAGKEKEGFGLTQFSVQRDHLHLIVEASNRHALSRGMQGLAVRTAKALNKLWHGRHGSVFAERYFARALRKPIELWRAIRYVLNNARKHGESSSSGQPDPYPSGRWFRDWSGSERVKRPLRGPPVVLGGRFALFHVHGWSIDIEDVPGRRADSAEITLDELRAAFIT